MFRTIILNVTIWMAFGSVNLYVDGQGIAQAKLPSNCFYPQLWWKNWNNERICTTEYLAYNSFGYFNLSESCPHQLPRYAIISCNGGYQVMDADCGEPVEIRKAPQETPYQGGKKHPKKNQLPGETPHQEDTKLRTSAQWTFYGEYLGPVKPLHWPWELSIIDFISLIAFPCAVGFIFGLDRKEDSMLRLEAPSSPFKHVEQKQL